MKERTFSTIYFRLLFLFTKIQPLNHEHYASSVIQAVSKKNSCDNKNVLYNIPGQVNNNNKYIFNINRLKLATYSTYAK